MRLFTVTIPTCTRSSGSSTRKTLICERQAGDLNAKPARIVDVTSRRPSKPPPAQAATGLIFVQGTSSMSQRFSEKIAHQRISHPAVSRAVLR